MRARFQAKFSKAEWYEYEAVSDDNVREGTSVAFGQSVLPVLELAGAKVIVSLDADLFGGGSPLAVKYARDFAAGRRLHDKNSQTEMNRLYVIEPLHTITGASADHRLACRAGDVEVIATELAAALGVEGVDAPKESKLPLRHSIKDDLEDNMGHSVVVAGPRQPWEVHILVAAINHKLGNVGKTVIYYPCPQPKRPSHAAALAALVHRIEAGDFKTLLILGGNPVYNAPADLKFADAMKKVPNTAHLALHEDETSGLCAWHLSRAHYLESWGDARTFDGTVSIVQPLIEPLFEGRSPIEVLSLVLDEKPRTGYEIVRETVKSMVGSPFTEYRWKKLLAEGAIEGTQWKPAQIGNKLSALFVLTRPSGRDADDLLRDSLRVEGEDTAKPVPETTLVKGQYELVFYPDKVHDGRFANNGWLQELPDPMTRLTWDNAAVMSEKTAERDRRQAGRTGRP